MNSESLTKSPDSAKRNPCLFFELLHYDVRFEIYKQVALLDSARSTIKLVREPTRMSVVEHKSTYSLNLISLLNTSHQVRKDIYDSKVRLGFIKHLELEFRFAAAPQGTALRKYYCSCSYSCKEMYDISLLRSDPSQVPRFLSPGWQPVNLQVYKGALTGFRRMFSILEDLQSVKIIFPREKERDGFKEFVFRQLGEEYHRDMLGMVQSCFKREPMIGISCEYRGFAEKRGGRGMMLDGTSLD